MIPSSMQATRKAPGPGCAHYLQAGAPTGRMAAHPTEKQAKKTLFAVDDWYLIVCKRLKGQPHGVPSTERPRLRRHYGYGVGIKPTSNHSQDYLSPWGQTTLGTCLCRHYHEQISTQVKKKGSR